MRQYILRRLAYLIPVLIGISIAVFLLLRVAPGDVCELIQGQGATEETLARCRQRLGLDKPEIVQYFEWAGGALRFDLGHSFFAGRPVIDEIVDRLPVTVELLVVTVLFTVAIGIPIGVISAVYQNSPLDYVARVVSIFGLSIPAFWLATLVILLPSLWWSYSPPIGHVSFFEDPWDNLRQFVPPALILAIASSAVLMRLTRSTLLEVLRNDYIRTARSKGLRERVVIGRHALKNALIPVVTVVGLQLAALLGGAVIIEMVFALPGLGLLTLEAIFRRDYPLVQAVSLYIAMVFVLINLAVDLAYAWLDPRIRYG
jgi:peptide/nickel transport system permease protein